MIFNPVLAKELRDRVRTWRSPLLISGYLFALAGIGGLNYYMQTRYNYGGTQALRLGLMTLRYWLLLNFFSLPF